MPCWFSQLSHGQYAPPDYTPVQRGEYVDGYPLALPAKGRRKALSGKVPAALSLAFMTASKSHLFTAQTVKKPSEPSHLSLNQQMLGDIMRI